MKLLCERINCSTEAKTIEHHTATLHYHASIKSWWIKLSPGVTGYESAPVEGLLAENRRWRHWSACAGTPGAWDSLVVPEAELDRLLDMLRLLEPVLAMLPCVIPVA